MGRTLQITYKFLIPLLLINIFSAQEKWNYSAEEMDQIKVNGQIIRRLKGNVQFVKTGQVILTDNAVQYIKEDILYMNGNTIMIKGLDTLTCDSMVYWSELDLAHAFNAIVINPTRGIIGDEMIIQYADSLIKEINVTTNAFAYNDLNVRIKENGPHRKFRDEMSSREMIAHFMDGEITHLELMDMATTDYHVINDSLLAGNNEASGDSILINFMDSDIWRIQVIGGALGKFYPEGDNTKIDTTVVYGANYIDYHIDDKKTFLSKSAYVEYQNTKLSAGEIVVDWQTNILDAVKVDEEYPMIRTLGEEPMKGNSMVFDLIAKHGRIDQGRTSFNQSFYHGKEVFRDDPNVFHVEKSKYTSCELDHPHFYLGSHTMKMLPGDKVITKALWLHIYDIPIVGIPLAVFPNKGGNRQSGWIMPSFESYREIGTGFKNFGYYWAPNNYIDAKTVMNFFDLEGIHINSSIKYKKRHGEFWYNYKLNGSINGAFKRRIERKLTDEIMDLVTDSLMTEIFRLTWNHSQNFDPTQKLGIKYEYISNKDAYQNTQEVDLQNRLKQNLASSFNYSKNWQTSSFSVGYNTFRDLGIENKSPAAFNNLNENRYKAYKYNDGPKFNFRIGSRKIFGSGDHWYNSFISSYSIKASKGRRDHWLIKELGNDSSWANGDTTKLIYGGFKHAVSLSAPQTFSNWLTLNPSLSLREDWIFNYKMLDDAGEKNMKGFKRRFTWHSSLSAKTKIYGLFPIKVGRLHAIRHIITPSISYEYQPDFSDPQFGGDLYFQKDALDENEPFDYFNGSYVGNTPKTKKQTYRLSVNNDFQAKIQNEEGKYNKSNFLTWSSSISYDPLKDSLKLSNMTSSIRVKKLSGNELFRIKMHHNFYRQNDGELIKIFQGELPQLTYIDIVTNLKFKLLGSKIGNIEESDSTGTDGLDDIIYNEDDQIQSNTGSHLWETQLDFSYGTNWRYLEKEWDYTFILNTRHKINLSSNWALSYTANFNLKEKEFIRNKFSIYRPLHCWEFNFSYWPGNSYSSGFSLEIKVRNPDLQDIKVRSSDANRSFGSY